MVDQKRSLLEAYLRGMADLGAWLVPAIVAGIVVVLAQRAFLPPPKFITITRGEEEK